MGNPDRYIYDEIFYFRFLTNYGLDLKKNVQKWRYYPTVCAVVSEALVTPLKCVSFQIKQRKEKKKVRNKIKGSTRKRCYRTERGRRSFKRREETKIYLL